MEKTIAVIRGDGIGPEIVEQAIAVLDTAAKKFGHSFCYTEAPMGGCAIDEFGVPLPVQHSTPVGLHRPPTLFRRARLRFFPIIAIFTDYKLFYRFHPALSRAETENVCIAGQSRV